MMEVIPTANQNSENPFLSSARHYETQFYSTQEKHNQYLWQIANPKTDVRFRD